MADPHPARKASTPADRRARNSPPAASQDLDRLIHDRIRLGILSALAVNTSLSFKDLKQTLQVSDGNLSVHARKLEDAGYIACSKGYEGRIPRTSFRLTREGKAALNKYLAHMEAIIQSVKKG